MPSLTNGPSGKAYWRSLDELADTPAFRGWLAREFPNLAPELSGSTRRQFLKIMGASLGLAGLTACRWPKETIVPFANRPDGRTPGVPVEYATAMELGGIGSGLLVTSYDGRPIKVEGNELHPFSKGASSAFAQAAILELYDPDRSRHPSVLEHANRTAKQIPEFERFAREHFASLSERDGGGLFILGGSNGSPTFNTLKSRLLSELPAAKWFEFEAISRDNERGGTRLAFGRALRTQLDFTHADVVLSLDDDFLLNHPAMVRYTRDYAAGRTAEDGSMSRLYMLESTFSLTGSNADVRHALRSSELPAALAALARELIDAGLELPAQAAEPAAALHEAESDYEYLPRIAAELLAHRGRGIITVGPRQPAEAHALAALLNAALGNIGSTVRYVDAPDPDRTPHRDAIVELTDALKRGEVDTLVILGGNPVFTAPADLEFVAALAKAKTSIHLSLYEDETSRASTWHVPAAHFLESWGDTRAWDGTVSLVQPLIAPLYDGISSIELLAVLLGDASIGGYDLVRKTFRDQFAGAADFESAWRRALHDGVVPRTAFTQQSPKLSNADWAAIASRLVADRSPSDGEFELVFTQDHSVYDGRFANSGWLQELPDPITKITWDNAALISVADARRLNVRRDDKIEITLAERRLTLPVDVVPGHAPGSITLPIGYGRAQAGIVGNDVGFDVSKLRTSDGWNVARGATVKRTRFTHPLATTQDHHAITSEVGNQEMAARIPELLREGTLAEFKDEPHFVRHRVHPLPLVQLFDEHAFPGKPRWAMTTDLSRCTGCSACVVACQAENNIPVVGKDEVSRGREMQWIRIDRYFSGDPADTDGVRMAHQPIMCQQCENAPCEQVCPVAATVHDEEGLNVMIYNRCIGTRYCLNNCPWKVRRFNWFYNHHGPAHPRSVELGAPPYPGTRPQEKLTRIEMMAFNPEVTVRTRGVMEKCTFCLQRIASAKIIARNRELAGGDGTIPDGTIRTACQQACPAEAIVFGDLNDEQGAVSKLFKNDRAYEMLEHLNTKPRNRYLAKLRNPRDGASHEAKEQQVRAQRSGAAYTG